jgi:hypothetical protein
MSVIIDRMQEDEETWSERNTAAEGEVAVLRERVDIQEATISALERRLKEMERAHIRSHELIMLLANPAPAGEMSIIFNMPDIESYES